MKVEAVHVAIFKILAFLTSLIRLRQSGQMRVVNKGRTKFACGHSEDVEVTVHSDDYTAHSGCENTHTNRRS
jgi:hypothetical protein